jgi:hypothetical protein
MCFGYIYANHQEVQLYVYSIWYLLFSLGDSVVLVGLIVYIRLYFLMMDQDILEMCRG